MSTLTTPQYVGTTSVEFTEGQSNNSVQYFTWPDYLVFFVMLIVSAAIGVFFGVITRSKDKTTKEFLMAGQSMGPFPVGMSLIASFISAIALLGTPSEVYQYGYMYVFIVLAYVVVMVVTGYLYLPVFWNLDITSVYQYLEMRFHKSVRRLAATIFLFNMTLYMGIVVYAPSLALAQVTGVNLYFSVFAICLVCMFYTSVGGMRAVLWNDTVQVTLMMSTMLFIAIYGTIDSGGGAYVWKKAVESERIGEVEWNGNPTIRHSFWSLTIGGFVNWLSMYAVNQAQVQRCLCARGLNVARASLFMNLAGLTYIVLTTAFLGLVIYARYSDCDPITSGAVTTGDQLLPYFVMDTMGQFKGLPGLFVAGVFSGALGSVSAGMSSLAAITLEDFVKGFCCPSISPRASTIVSRCLTIMYGLITLGLAFLAKYLGNVLTAALGLFGAVGGSLLGMFTLGIFFPWVNAIGCFVGALTSLIFMMFIYFTHYVAKNLGYIVLEQKVTSVMGCDLYNSTWTDANSTITEPHLEPSWLQNPLFELSYIWYSTVGLMITLTVGLVVSCATGGRDVRTLNPKTISPIIYEHRHRLPGLRELGEQFISDEMQKYDFNEPSSYLLQSR